MLLTVWDMIQIQAISQARLRLRIKDATPVTITGTDSSTAYTGTSIDVSQYFNASTLMQELPVIPLLQKQAEGAGEGSLNGSILTVTKTGTFKIKVSTVANGIYAAGEQIVTLTVNNGTIQYMATDCSTTYDGQSHSISVNVTNPEGTAEPTAPMA